MTPAICLALAVLMLTWALAGGPSGCAYILIFALCAAPGLPVGFALFGRHHAAGWISGSILGYALTAFAIHLPIQAGFRGTWPALLAWVLLCLLAAPLLRVTAPLVVLPRWTRRDTVALLLVLLIVPAVTAAPFLRIGSRDSDGNTRYRAYFTADFLWHVALTSELTKQSSPPRNPYLARRPLHYYWTYFNVPAALVAAGGVVPGVAAHLTINALLAGLLFVAAIFLAAWCVVPRAGPVAAAVVLTVVAASAEGAYALVDLLVRGAPLSELKGLNIDAITSWYFQSQTIDGLPRSLWYTPQHAAACALSLVALIVVGASDGPRRAESALVAGLALALAVAFSPFLGGVFAIVYGIVAMWSAARLGRGFVRVLLQFAVAGLPVILALAWCAASGTFEGAGGRVALGLSPRAAAAPVVMPLLALGPVLLPALAGVILGRRHGWRSGPAVVSLAVGLFLLYFVTLTVEPIWVGWRAGQLLLVTLPGLAAALFASLIDRGRRTVAIFIGVTAISAGVPTTMIDTWNAQDVHNVALSPGGFRWTVVVSPSVQAATTWLRANTPPDALVQMSIAPRGRETWTLIPSFAQRRMAAGHPISLLRMPEYDLLSTEVDAMYRAVDASEAARLARSLRIDFIYLDDVERAAFGEAVSKFSDARFFEEVFRQGSAAVYAVR